MGDKTKFLMRKAGPVGPRLAPWMFTYNLAPNRPMNN